MSMKKLKQQVASALIIAMTATNVLSAFAAETVIGKPNKKDSVTVTFDAKGGYWETASKSSVSDGRQGALLADTVIDGYYVGADGAWVPAS